MPEQKIESGRIATSAVTNDKLAGSSVTGDKLAASSITGDKLTVNSVRANNIVAGAIGGNTLASNLHISLTQVLETGNVYSVAVGGNVNIDLENNTVYFFSSNTTANVTFNFRANTQNTLDSQMNVGQTITSAILLKQGATRYRANVYVDGVLQSPWWLGNSAPSFATTQQESIDLYSFNILKTAANAYTLLASNASFQRALSQNP
jgi:hypothetical protein